MEGLSGGRSKGGLRRRVGDRDDNRGRVLWRFPGQSNLEGKEKLCIIRAKCRLLYLFRTFFLSSSPK